MSGDERSKPTPRRRGSKRASKGGAQANAGEAERVERAILERQREEKRQSSGSTPTEDLIERASREREPGVEWHAGEDAGQAPDRRE